MTSHVLPDVVIAISDHLRLEGLVAQAAAERHPGAGFLLTELRRAAVVMQNELPAGTVTLNRWVSYRSDWGWPVESRVLVCPQDYRSAAAHLSVLSRWGPPSSGSALATAFHTAASKACGMSPASKVSIRPSVSPHERRLSQENVMTELRTALPPITLTEGDFDRLERLAAAAAAAFPRTAKFLAREIGRAKIVDSSTVPPGIIGMGSAVAFRDETTGNARDVTLVYPDQADMAAGRISILSPIGAALIGLAAGQSIEWQSSDGGWRSLTVLTVDGKAS